MFRRVIILFTFLFLLSFETVYAAFPVYEYNTNILETNNVYYNIPEGLRIILIILLSGGGFLLGLNSFSATNNSKFILISFNLLLLLALVYS